MNEAFFGSSFAGNAIREAINVQRTSEGAVEFDAIKDQHPDLTRKCQGEVRWCNTAVSWKRQVLDVDGGLRENKHGVAEEVTCQRGLT